MSITESHLIELLWLLGLAEFGTLAFVAWAAVSLARIASAVEGRRERR